MKVNIIGPYPPPYGGISVHIKRMKKYLIRSGVDVKVYKDNKKAFLKALFLKGEIIHFHSISKKKRILMGFLAVFYKKIILTIHGESLHDQLEQSNWFIKRLLIFSLKKINKIICVNPKTLKELISYGIAASNLAFIPSYINPIEDENDSVNIPSFVWNFINNAEFLISANGWITFYKHQDLYGMDMLIQLMRKLNHEHYNVSLFIALLGTNMQSQQERSYYNDLKNKIINYELERNILIFEVNDTEFYPILKKSSLFIRPTNADGYGVSIAEALYYKVPSIASDVCSRPEGTIIFRSRQIDDLYIKAAEVIKNYDLYQEKIKNIELPNNAEKILNVYKELDS